MLQNTCKTKSTVFCFENERKKKKTFFFLCLIFWGLAHSSTLCVFSFLYSPYSLEATFFTKSGTDAHILAQKSSMKQNIKYSMGCLYWYEYAFFDAVFLDSWLLAMWVQHTPHTHSSDAVWWGTEYSTVECVSVFDAIYDRRCCCCFFLMLYVKDAVWNITYILMCTISMMPSYQRWVFGKKRNIKYRQCNAQGVLYGFKTVDDAIDQLKFHTNIFTQFRFKCFWWVLNTQNHPVPWKTSSFFFNVSLQTDSQCKIWCLIWNTYTFEVMTVRRLKRSKCQKNEEKKNGKKREWRTDKKYIYLYILSWSNRIILHCFYMLCVQIHTHMHNRQCFKKKSFSIFSFLDFEHLLNTFVMDGKIRVCGWIDWIRIQKYS